MDMVFEFLETAGSWTFLSFFATVFRFSCNGDDLQPSCVAAIAMSREKTHDRLQTLLCALCRNVLHLRLLCLTL